MTDLPLAPPAVPLPTGFKGTRNYLQSADLWNACVEALFGDADKADWSMRMNFRALTDQAPLLVPLDEARDRPGRFAEVIASRDDRRLSYVLVESGQPAVGRYEDKESSLNSAVQIDGDVARFDGPLAATPIELIVAMTKKLHLTSVDKDVRWLATRLALPAAIGDVGKATYEVQLGPLVGKRASRSTVAVDGQVVGEIAFNAIEA
ncbi:hypothetical protein [Methyloceanibacter sp. wino2]|uniref:hypothetical protein n=1 Tax=Methyloceanibacter sp. wino2 TaxID=2170729 RepID=UPI000D3E7940|nr:hypothetical protein [Methyloceanibacter sp. wino2]